MRIALLNSGILYPLAGALGVSERTHSSVGNYTHEPTSVTQIAQRVRATYAKPLDRSNLLHNFSFSTTRLFATPQAAHLWDADYSSAFPSTGTVYLDAVAADGTWKRRVMAEAVVEPPRRVVRGCTVLLDYLIRGGAITAPFDAEDIVIGTGITPDLGGMILTRVDTGAITHAASKWSTDGTSTPPATGRWIIIDDGAPLETWKLSLYEDGVVVATWTSNAGDDPVLTTWSSSRTGTAAGDPDLSFYVP